MPIKNTERRTHVSSSREAMRNSLSELQLMTLKRIEEHGWRLQFVRAHQDSEVIAVVYDSQTSQLAVIERDGHLDMKPGLKFRRD